MLVLGSPKAACFGRVSSKEAILMRRLSILLGVAVLVLVVAAASAGRSAVALTVHEADSSQLLVPGDQAEVKYVIQTQGVVKPTGTVYVRRDGQSAFTALQLKLGVDITNGRHPSLHLVLPASFLRGQRLFYYARLQDPASGASITIPAKGAGAPQTSWIMYRPTVVRLGAYRFGHPEAAQAVVARAAAKNVGWDLPSQKGPQTFLVGRDRSVWLEDTWKHRMLVWQAGKPNKPVRTVPLPTEGRNDNSFEDVAFGPKGTLYVSRIQSAVPGFQVFRIDAKTGGVLWKSSSSPLLSPTLPLSGMPLRVGVDGTLYTYVSPQSFEALDVTGTPSYGWMPLANPAGKPVPPAQQFNRIVWGYEPASAGRRFIAEFHVPLHARYMPREQRFAVVNRYGRLLHSWRITSKTAMGRLGLEPQLLNGSVVADLTRSRPGTLEHFFVRLDAKGLDAKASIPFRIWGDYHVTDVRIGPDGKIYALATSPKTGIVIRRYVLG
jgi:hypothetical protein